MTSITELIKEVERFAERHNMTKTRVSRFLTHNPNFLDRLRNGGDVYSKTEKRIRRKIKKHDKLKGLTK